MTNYFQKTTASSDKTQKKGTQQHAKYFNILTSEYLIIAIIICIITLSFLVELPRRNPRAFFYLVLAVLGWYLGNIANIAHKCVNNIYAVKLRHIFGFMLTLFLVYGFAYYSLYNLDAASFNGPILLDRSKSLEFGTYFDMIYFTMSTFSTAGFGDITPVSRLARGIVMSQFIAGFTLVAILLGRVVD
jgi:hypothetical protein